MTLVVVDQGEKSMLESILAVNYTLRLFTNDVSEEEAPDELTEADFIEADFTGYEAKALTGGSWTATAGDPAEGEYAVQAFVSSEDQAPQTVYGYYVTKTASGELVWFESFVDEQGDPAPITIQYNGEAIRVTPRLTLADAQD